MPKKKVVNEKALLKMIEDGKPQTEVMQKFDFKNSGQLKVAYANALMSAGKVPELIKSTGKSAKSNSKTVSVNKRGSLVIPKGMVAEFGLSEGDSFTVRKTKTGVSLKKVQ
jgi:hypothetical protein